MRFALSALFCLLPLVGSAKTARATLITFSEQPGGEGPLTPNHYSSAQGLPPGVTADFVNFVRYDLDYDHTNNGDNHLIYGKDESPTSIVFNGPVEVPSLWVTTGPFGSPAAQVIGTLNGSTQFSFTNNGPTDTFHEVTAGVGKSIDTLTFTSFRDSELDDVTIDPVPEPFPSCTGFVLAMSLMVTHRRRRRFAPKASGEANLER